jgi:ribosomal protein S18 acetylase RimI-like enzyme
MVTDYLHYRDAAALKQMLHDDRAVLGGDGHDVDGIIARSQVAVVRCNGETVGAAVFGPCVQQFAHLELLVVHRQHRRKGYGDALLTHFMVESFRHGALWLTLFTRPTNHTAQALYTNRFGFHIFRQDDANVIMVLPKHWAGVWQCVRRLHWAPIFV